MYAELRWVRVGHTGGLLNGKYHPRQWLEESRGTMADLIRYWKKHPHDRPVILLPGRSWHSTKMAPDYGWVLTWGLPSGLDTPQNSV